MPRVNIYSRLIQVIITVSLSLTVSPSHAKPQVKSEHIGAWLNHYVMPSYGALHEANLNLQRQASLLCSELSLEALDDMQPYLTQAMEAYAYSQAVDGGPMHEQMRNFQLYFWPDRNNSVSRQLEKLLTKPDFSMLQGNGLVNASVALTGYPALERLIFEPNYRHQVVENEKNFICSYIIAVSDHLVRLTGEINSAWQTSWYPQLLKPGHDQFKKKADQVSFVFSNIDLLLTKIISKKLTKPLGSSAQRAKSRRLESWRSGNSLTMLKANALALSESLNLVLKPSLVEAGEDLEWQYISHELRAIDQQLEQLPRPLVNYLNQPQFWQATQNLNAQFIQLQKRLRKIYPRLNVRLGFNAYDGD